MAKVAKYVQESFLDDLVCPANAPEAEPDSVVGLSIGTILKARRLKTGGRKGVPETTGEVARELCLQPQYIEAIEADQFDLLPGATYAKGFIRSYAQYLGLDAAQLVQRYRQEIEVEKPASQLLFPEPMEKRQAPKWAVACATLFLMASTYGIWLGVSRDTSSSVPSTETADDGLTEPESPVIAENSQGTRLAQANTPAPMVSPQNDRQALDDAAAAKAGSGAEPAPLPSKSIPVSVSPVNPLNAISPENSPPPDAASAHLGNHSYFRHISLDYDSLSKDGNLPLPENRVGPEKGQAGIWGSGASASGVLPAVFSPQAAAGGHYRLSLFPEAPAGIRDRSSP